MPLKVTKRVERRTAQPLYQQVKEAIKESIERGELKPGEPLPGRLELCRLFGANRLTVDRAIAELVREGWVVAVKGKGTFVATPQERSRQQTVLTFAVVWSHYGIHENNIYWGPLLRGISHEAGEVGARLLFREVPPDFYADLFHEVRADGLIVLAPLVEDELILRQLRDRHIPFVATSSAYGDERLPCVDTDNFAGVKAALEHLWQLGHRNIAMINLDLKQTDLLRRWEAFQKLMGDAGYRLDPRWALLFPDRRLGVREEVVRQWLDSVPLPTAMFVADYETTLVVLKVLRERGIKVPEQLSVVGFDDPASAAFLDPPLTTVRQPVEQLGRRAVQKLTDALRKGVMPEGTELLAPELIVRRSTAPALQTLTSPGQGRKIKGAVNPSKEVHRHAAFGVHTD
jgi:DNA-binding LacI/PurR family transcriptional regulator